MNILTQIKNGDQDVKYDFEFIDDNKYSVTVNNEIDLIKVIFHYLKLYKAHLTQGPLHELSNLLHQHRNYTSSKDYYKRGKKQREQKQYNDAVHSYTLAIEIDSENYLAYYERGITYIELKQFKEAIDDFTTVLIHNNEKYHHGYYYRGCAYLNLKEYDNARTNYDDFIRNYKTDFFSIHEEPLSNAYYYRGMIHTISGDHHKAYDDYGAAMVGTSNLAIYYEYALCCYKLKQYMAAHFYIKLAIDKGYINAHSCFLLGQLEYAFAQYDNAISAFNQAVQLGYTQGDVHFYLGRSLQSKGNFEEAVTKYQQAIKYGENVSEINYQLCICYYRLNNIPPLLELINQFLNNKTLNDNQLENIITILGFLASNEQCKQEALSFLEQLYNDCRHGHLRNHEFCLRKLAAVYEKLQNECLDIDICRDYTKKVAVLTGKIHNFVTALQRWCVETIIDNPQESVVNSISKFTHSLFGQSSQFEKQNALMTVMTKKSIEFVDNLINILIKIENDENNIELEMPTSNDANHYIINHLDDITHCIYDYLSVYQDYISKQPFEALHNIFIEYMNINENKKIMHQDRIGINKSGVCESRFYPL